MKGDQAYMRNYNHELQSFQDHISSLALRYVEKYLYNMTYITCITYK